MYKDYDEALAAIEKYDNGWYDDHIVKYYDLSDEGRKKVQEWNEKRDAYSQLPRPMADALEVGACISSS